MVFLLTRSSRDTFFCGGVEFSRKAAAEDVRLEGRSSVTLTGPVECWDSVFITVGGVRIQRPSVDFTERRVLATRTVTCCVLNTVLLMCYKQ